MIKNATIKAVGVNSRTYQETKGVRGTPEFIMSPSSLKRFGENPEDWLATGAMVAKFRKELETLEPGARRSYFKRRLKELEGPSKTQEFGLLLDCMLLTPQHFSENYAVTPSTYTEIKMQCPKCDSITDSQKCSKCKREREPVEVEKDWSANASKCQVWEAEKEKQGIEVVSVADYSRICEAVERFNSKPNCRRVVEASDVQVHVIGEWHDRDTGMVVPVQCLIDMVPRLGTPFIPSVEANLAAGLADLKSSVVIDSLRFSRHVERFGWHIQAAFDLALYEAATHEGRTDWILIGQKNYGAFSPFAKMLDGNYIAAGTSAFNRLLSNYCQCLKHNKWPDADATESAIYGFDLIRPDVRLVEREALASNYAFEEEAETEDPEPSPEEEFTP